MKDNLPPGVSVNDIPGNTPGDESWEMFHAWIDEQCCKEALDVRGAMFVWSLGLGAFRSASQLEIFTKASTFD